MFSHGQLYVASSRGKNKNKLKISISNDGIYVQDSINRKVNKRKQLKNTLAEDIINQEVLDWNKKILSFNHYYEIITIKLLL